MSKQTDSKTKRSRTKKQIDKIYVYDFKIQDILKFYSDHHTPIGLEVTYKLSVLYSDNSIQTEKIEIYNSGFRTVGRLEKKVDNLFDSNNEHYFTEIEENAISRISKIIQQNILGDTSELISNIIYVFDNKAKNITNDSNLELWKNIKTSPRK